MSDEQSTTLLFFLEMNGVLESYLKYLLREGEENITEIDNAFTWRDTEEGFRFWSSLNNQYNVFKTNTCLPTLPNYFI